MAQALTDKVVVVTGGSKGMGRAFVDALVSEGAQVAALARPSPELDDVEAPHAGRAAAIPCDVSSSAEVNRAIAAVIARFGRIDALINNAAIFHPFDIETVSDELVDRHIDINLRGIVWLIRAALPHLKESRGQIVSVSSESVRTPFPMLSLYAGTKAAVEAMSAGLRDELRQFGVRVSVLRSGSVSGGTGGQAWDPAAAQKFLTTIARTGHAAMSGASASPESMARALVALLSIPADVNIDMLEARSAEEGVPPSVAAATQGGSQEA